jgi:hypothetical protein
VQSRFGFGGLDAFTDSKNLLAAKSEKEDGDRDETPDRVKCDILDEAH